MGRLRRYCQRQGRFHFAVLLTIVVVTYLLVPWIVNLIDASRGYNPFYYEPKDFSRGDFIARHGLPPRSISPWKVAVDVVLVFAVVVVWLTVLPRRRSR